MNLGHSSRGSRGLHALNQGFQRNPRPIRSKGGEGCWVVGARDSVLRELRVCERSTEASAGCRDLGLGHGRDPLGASVKSSKNLKDLQKGEIMVGSAFARGGKVLASQRLALHSSRTLSIAGPLCSPRRSFRDDDECQVPCSGAGQGAIHLGRDTHHVKSNKRCPLEEGKHQTVMGGDAKLRHRTPYTSASSGKPGAAGSERAILRNPWSVAGWPLRHRQGREEWLSCTFLSAAQHRRTLSTVGGAGGAGRAGDVDVMGASCPLQYRYGAAALADPGVEEIPARTLLVLRPLKDLT